MRCPCEGNGVAGAGRGEEDEHKQKKDEEEDDSDDDRTPPPTKFITASQVHASQQIEVSSQ